MKLVGMPGQGDIQAGRIAIGPCLSFDVFLAARCELPAVTGLGIDLTEEPENGDDSALVASCGAARCAMDSVTAPQQRAPRPSTLPTPCKLHFPMYVAEQVATLQPIARGHGPCAKPAQCSALTRFIRALRAPLPAARVEHRPHRGQTLRLPHALPPARRWSHLLWANFNPVKECAIAIDACCSMAWEPASPRHRAGRSRHRGRPTIAGAPTLWISTQVICCVRSGECAPTLRALARCPKLRHRPPVALKGGAGSTTPAPP